MTTSPPLPRVLRRVQMEQAGDSCFARRLRRCRPRGGKAASSRSSQERRGNFRSCELRMLHRCRVEWRPPMRGGAWRSGGAARGRGRPRRRPATTVAGSSVGTFLLLTLGQLDIWTFCRSTVVQCATQHTVVGSSRCTMSVREWRRSDPKLWLQATLTNPTFETRLRAATRRAKNRASGTSSERLSRSLTPLVYSKMAH